MKKRSYIKHIIDFLLVLLPAILIYLLVSKDALYSADVFVTDKLYSQMNGTGDKIKLVCIDEKTLAAFGNFEGWSRDKSADLINLLYEDNENAPAVLAFDIMFVGNGNKNDDEKLYLAAKDAVSKGGTLVGATNMVYKGKTVYDLNGQPYYDAMNIELEELPYSPLADCIESGFANVQLPKDGFVRTTQIATNVNDKKRYSFASTIAKLYGEKEGISIPWEQYEEDKVLHFFYSGKPEEFTHFSLYDVLEGNVPKQEFADSIVLVGVYAPGMMDSYHSAAKRSQEMYGVEINANITKALLEGKVARRGSIILQALICALILAIYTFLARKMKMYPALLVGVWILLAQLILGRVLAAHGIIINMIYIPLVVLLVMGWVIIEKYVFEIIKRKRVLKSFQKYMAPQVIESLAKNGDFHIELGGEKREIAVLFVDIRGFTSMSEKLTPEQVVLILNQYLEVVTKCIFAHGGMLDKFIGDAAMAIFNAPKDQEDYLYQAILAGLDMQKEGIALKQKLEKEYGRSVDFGVGVHVGEAVVGNIGSESRMDYTAIGDTVNTASRIEGKSLGGELLISEEVCKLLQDRIEVEFKEAMALKGKQEPVKVYKVLGTK